MSSRTRTRGGAAVHTVRIPRQRGRRGSDPFVVVMPERPSLAHQALTGLALMLWDHRRALAPIGFAVLALVAGFLLHTIAWWSGLLLAPLAAGPLVWLWLMQCRRRGTGSVLAWRIGVTTLATSALVWLALAAGFGPLAGPLELIWLLTLITAQTAWLIIRRTH
ncbi:hypothetical protein [Streptomyces sp. PAN_FS17]|uniref:hypothetical protein n=1 Tax=Streptomyces sp. PAN_FS17 TaxID=1855351 RepID=UPI000898BCAD|nr:hypothetical protein [Streptomyces sp. PAN_FS17]SEC64719.1 hypothetical protein SAMN05216482_4084 [Streptomyces sp. PAN_FS17]